MISLQCSLMARLLGFNPRGLTSIPGVGDLTFIKQIQYFIAGFYILLFRLNESTSGK